MNDFLHNKNMMVIEILTTIMAFGWMNDFIKTLIS